MAFKSARHMNLSSFKAMDIMRLAQDIESQKIEAQNFDVSNSEPQNSEPQNSEPQNSELQKGAASSGAAHRTPGTAARSVCHLEIGQPATPAPRAARARLRHMLDDPAAHGYTVALGLTPLREQIADLYQRWYGVSVDPARIIITVGSSLGFTMAMLACFDPGDRIALPSPGYPAYRNLTRVLGLEAVDVPVGAAQNWRLTRDALNHISPRPHGLILASPANPTGVMLSANELSDIAHWCHEHGVRLISDEIYHGITYDEPATTMLDMTPELIVVNSFSKYFSMTGHRIGWMIVPEPLIDPLERLAQNLVISAPSLSQYAALAVLQADASADELQAHVARYHQNRDHLCAHLPAEFLGRFAPPQGAFYLYCDISALGADSMTLSHRLLREAGVATTPGIDFDPLNGNAYVRLSYARQTDEVIEACARITTWLKG